MKLIDALLDVGKDSSKFAIRDNEIAIRYNKKRNLMVYCDRETGKYSDIEFTSIWGYGSLFDDGWKVKTVVDPKYKVGDKFLINHLGCEICCQETVISKQVSSNVVVEVNGYYVKEDRILYTVCSEDKRIILVLNEEYLSNLDMVVSQDVMK